MHPAFMHALEDSHSPHTLDWYQVVAAVKLVSYVLSSIKARESVCLHLLDLRYYMIATVATGPQKFGSCPLSCPDVEDLPIWPRSL